MNTRLGVCLLTTFAVAATAAADSPRSPLRCAGAEQYQSCPVGEYRTGECALDCRQLPVTFAGFGADGSTEADALWVIQCVVQLGGYSGILYTELGSHAEAECVVGVRDHETPAYRLMPAQDYGAPDTRTLTTGFCAVSVHAVTPKPTTGYGVDDSTVYYPCAQLSGLPDHTAPCSVRVGDYCSV